MEYTLEELRTKEKNFEESIELADLPKTEDATTIRNFIASLLFIVLK